MRSVFSAYFDVLGREHGGFLLITNVDAKGEYRFYVNVYTKPVCAFWTRFRRMSGETRLSWPVFRPYDARNARRTRNNWPGNVFAFEPKAFTLFLRRMCDGQDAMYEHHSSSLPRRSPEAKPKTHNALMGLEYGNTLKTRTWFESRAKTTHVPAAYDISARISSWMPSTTRILLNSQNITERM